MQYSSLQKKHCKCSPDCTLWPDISFEGFSRLHAPQEVLDRLETKQKRKKAVTKAVSKIRSEQYAEGNFEDAERQYLINDLDFCFSRIVRMSAAVADKYANCVCYTCGIGKHWSMQQCGHFIKRANTELRWDFRNARVQCKNCNENQDGNMEVYEKRLNEEHEGLPNQLREIATTPYKHSREELKILLIDLRAKLRLVETKFKTT